MPDFVLQDDQNVDCAVTLNDDANNAVPGSTLDAGSLVVTISDDTGSGSPSLVATVSADQSSVNVKALGPEVTGVTVTANGSVGGTPVPNPGVLAFDVTGSPATTIGLVPGTPVHN